MQRSDPQYARRSRRAGGSRRVRALVHRLLAAGHTKLVNGPLVLDLQSRRMSLGEHRIELPGRERSVLLVLLARTGMITSKRRMAQFLSIGPNATSLNIIESYVGRVRRKLAPAGVVIRTVRGSGYVLERLPG